jgi:glycosyltransferase involved in cell wall biosynthesis
MTGRVALYLGDFSSFNVVQTTRNIGRMLHSEFDLDLISTNPSAFPNDVSEYYTVHGGDCARNRLGEVAALRGYLRTHRPDIITHVGDVPVYGNTISMMADEDMTFVCRYSGNTFHEYKAEVGTRRAKIFALKNVWGRLSLYTADKFVTLGPRVKQRLVSRGIPSTDVRILPPPVDPSRFEGVEEPELSIPNDRSVVLFVGRVSRLKGAVTLEETIPRILARRPDLQFVLVGDIQYDIQIPARYRDHVTAVGRVPPEEVPPYFALADLYVHPSLTEGISRSVIEALLSGTPVVARDVGDLSYATSNLFLSDEDLVDAVCHFEALPIESGEKFTIRSLKDRYLRFYSDIG